MRPRWQADYKAIRDIPVNDIPDTFNAWAYAQAQHGANIVSGGHAEVPIEVNASKLRAFCARTGKGANLQAIKDFVVEEFGRQEEEKAKLGAAAADRSGALGDQPNQAGDRSVPEE